MERTTFHRYAQQRQAFRDSMGSGRELGRRANRSRYQAYKGRPTRSNLRPGKMSREDWYRLESFIKREPDLDRIIRRIAEIFDRIPTFTASKFIKLMHKTRHIKLSSAVGNKLTERVVARFTHRKTEMRQVVSSYFNLIEMEANTAIANGLLEHFLSRIDSCNGLEFTLVLKTIKRLGYKHLYENFIDHFIKYNRRMSLDGRVASAHQLKEIGVDVIERGFISLFDILPDVDTEDKTIEAAIFTLDPNRVHVNKEACTQLLSVFERFIPRAPRAAILRIAKIVSTLDRVPTYIYASIVHRILRAKPGEMEFTNGHYIGLMHFMKKAPKELERELRELAHKAWQAMVRPEDKSALCNILFNSQHIVYTNLHYYVEQTLKEDLNNHSLAILAEVAIQIDPLWIVPTQEDLKKEDAALEAEFERLGYEEGEVIAKDVVIDTYRGVLKNRFCATCNFLIRRQLPTMNLSDLADIAYSTSLKEMREFDLRTQLSAFARAKTQADMETAPAACYKIGFTLAHRGEGKYEKTSTQLFKAALANFKELSLKDRARLLSFTEKLNTDSLLESLLNEPLDTLDDDSLTTIVSYAAKAKKYDTRVERAIDILIAHRIPLHNLSILAKAIATFTATLEQPTPFNSWFKRIIELNLDQIAGLDVKGLTRFLACAIILDLDPKILSVLKEALSRLKFDIDQAGSSFEERELSTYVARLGFKQQETLHGILKPDFFLPGPKPLAIEYDGTWHYLPGTKRRNGSTILRNTLYRKLGISLFVISYLDWPKNTFEREQFLRERIDAILEKKGPYYIGA
ncbi:MAG: RAP domain-containing protein [Simkaniaceae bacterium]|nr:RAP domain-containing protein [Simkaniaceae bacterium]